MNETGSGHSPYIDAYINNVSIIRYNDIKLVVNLLHISDILGNLMGGIQQRKIR
jgi:hypothetical protein